MGDKLQEILEKEKILENSNKLRLFNLQIKKDNNKLLREYYSEFAKIDEFEKYSLGAFKFLQWIIENK